MTRLERAERGTVFSRSVGADIPNGSPKQIDSVPPVANRYLQQAVGKGIKRVIPLFLLFGGPNGPTELPDGTARPNEKSCALYSPAVVAPVCAGCLPVEKTV